MKFGLMLPNKGSKYGDPNVLLGLAIQAEQAGWDGFFIWDHIGGGGKMPTTDPWICLAAIASHTESMRIGPMVTPLSRRRPWKVAREIVTLDHLSKGRCILGVGVGAMEHKDFAAFGDVADIKLRAEMLDEGLDIISGLQSGENFEFSGKHYQIEKSLFQPVPVQQPHIPVWVAAHWPFRGPLQRAARWEGVLPRQWNAGPISPEVISEIAEMVQKHRKDDRPFDICKYGITAGKNLSQDRALVKPYQGAGATWWMEEIFSGRGSVSKIEKRIAAGPPR